MKRGKMFKRSMAYIITMVMVVGLMNGLVFEKEVQAATMTLAQLKSKFPAGKYWNHWVGTNKSDWADNLMNQGVNGERFANNVTSHACATHNGNGLNRYDCNVFDGGMQCCGFARKLAYDAYGSRSTSWPNTSLSNIKAGDVLHYSGSGAHPEYGHWVFVTKVNGNAITVGECNTDSGLCAISWGRVIYKNKITAKQIKSAPHKLSDDNPDPIKKPDTPGTITLNSTALGKGDSIIASWKKVNRASSYDAKLVCSSNSAYNQSKRISGTSVSFVLKNEGNYYISLTASNSAGTSGARNSSSATVYKNSTVRWLDYDDSVIKTESIKYNGNATPPTTNPTREGYTFQGWDSSYKNIKKDTDIKAVYKINTYSVSFVDYQNNVIGSIQKIDYGSSAIPPLEDSIPIKEGYIFTGWNCDDYKNVKKNLTIKAVYEWENTDLPLIMKVISAERNEEATGYRINVKLSNFPNNFTKGKVVVALKTKQGKMVASETRQVSLPEEDEVTEKITVLYSGIVSTVEVSMVGVIDDETTGTPKAKSILAPIDVGNEWSDWSETVPDGEGVISESRTEYRYKDSKTIKDTKQPTTPAGYELISSTKTGTYTAWGAWSAWSTTPQTGNTLKEVGTTTGYRYYVFRCSSCGTRDPYSGACSKCGKNSLVWNQTYHNQIGGSISAGTVNSAKGYAYISGTKWYYELPGTGNGEGGTGQPTCKMYRYRTRSEYVNYKYKQTSFSNWQAEAVTSSDTREVETRTAYRFKTNDTTIPCYNYKRYKYTNLNNGKIIYTYSSVYPNSMDYPGEWEYLKSFSQLSFVSMVDDDIELYNGTGDSSWYRADLNDESDSKIFETTTTLEDTSGVSRHCEGNLENSPRKVVTLMVYKGQNTDPTASQIEYIGQTTTDENGNYSFDYVTKEEPSLLTGDFVITIGVEGATNYINIGKIEAPKPVYKVDFVDGEDNLISETNVMQGGTAEAPDAPEKEGYEFLGWDTGLKNIQENTLVKAIYRKKTYSVVFVDWDESFIDIDEFEYGSELIIDMIPEKAGQKFTNWINEDGDDVFVVTGNMVVTAKYEDAKYSIQFFDWNGNLISEQVVEYGEEAEEPVIEECPDEDRIFCGWSSGGEEKYVTQNLCATPLSRFKNDNEKPMFTVSSGTYSDEQKVGIYALESDVDIYYHVEYDLDDETTGEETDYEEIIEDDENELIEEEEFIKYKSPISIDKSAIVYAYVKSDFANDSEIAGVTLRIGDEELITGESTTEIATEETTVDSTTEEITTEELTTQAQTTTSEVTSADQTTKNTETTTSQAPTKPSGLQGVVDKNDNYNLFWMASSNATYYNVYVNGENVGNTVTTSYRIPASFFTASGEYTVEVEAVNASGTSEKASIKYIVENDVTTKAETTTVAPTTTAAPTTTEERTTKEPTTAEPTTSKSKPGNPISVQGIVDKNDNYNLYWVASEGATYYNVYVNDELVGNTVSTNYRIPASFFNKSGVYTIEVEAVNEIGTSGRESAIYEVKFDDPTTIDATTAIVTTQEETTTEIQTTGDETTAVIPSNNTTRAVQTTKKPETTTSDKGKIVVPTKVKGLKLKNIKKKKIKVSWNWQVYSTKSYGWQVQYSKKKNFKSAKTKNVKWEKESLILKNLSKKKTYYVHVRAWVVNNDNIKRYGAWSDVKKCKVKK